jgi:hypothetical protein
LAALPVFPLEDVFSTAAYDALEALAAERCLPAANLIFAALFRVFALDIIFAENENGVARESPALPLTEASRDSEASTDDDASVIPLDGADLNAKVTDLDGKPVYSNV